MEHRFLVIDVGKITQQELGSDLLFFRDDGALIRDTILPLIRNAKEDVVALDFEKVKGIDFSCSDEVIVMLQENVEWLNGKGLFLENLSQSHKENILSALDKKKQAIWYLNGDRFDILGDKLPPYLKELACIVKDRKSVYARQLADEFGNELSNVSMKLGQLYKRGLVRRIEHRSDEGMQFVYLSIV
jgi:DNA-binding MarR family transcriptional regulator